MVLYFTGTGNSRYLARRIAEGLEMPLYDLNACIKAGDTAPVQTGREAAQVLRQLQKLGITQTVMMTGDGINDSPALSAADIGIDIHSGAAIAREIADVTIRRCSGVSK